MYASDLEADSLEMVAVMELDRSAKGRLCSYASDLAGHSSHGRRAR